jgi:hypothetical protein
MLDSTVGGVAIVCAASLIESLRQGVFVDMPVQALTDSSENILCHLLAPLLAPETDS